MAAGAGNIYLAGMVGSGKTTLGRLIAKELVQPFLDLDAEILAETGQDLHGLVGAEGWLGFRVREYEMVKRFVAETNQVIGLGGGTVRYPWNLDLLAGTGPIVLLTADLDVLAARARAADRPRVNEGRTLEEDLAEIWESAGERYLAAADIVYATDEGKSATEEAAEIAALVDAWREAAKA
ncbi:MAG: shikimate kinase [Alphaproteobacteria bacterium]|jgi:shikimate kinase|nr:shikimate kinase [Alphaproteobacteria bacterium]